MKTAKNVDGKFKIQLPSMKTARIMDGSQNHVLMLLVYPTCRVMSADFVQSLIREYEFQDWASAEEYQ